MSNLAPRLAMAETTTETVEIMKDLESSARDLPERAAMYAKYLVPLFSNQSASVRKSAFNSALAIISNQPMATDQLISAYQCAILSPDNAVAQHAISYLPQFVSVCKVNAKELISTAIKTSQKRTGFTDSAKHIAEAMDVAKRLNNQK